MRKKLISLLCLLIVFLSLASCGGRNVLLFLNWGEYIDEELIELFEKKYNCEVVMDLADSNEIFYSKVRGGTTVYDVVAPSDYMVEKMYDNNMLEQLDFSKIPSYSKTDYLPGVNDIINSMESNHEGISNYFIPYLWGSWGIMYSTLVEGLEDKVVNSMQNTNNNWSSLFNRSYLPESTRVAMYDSHQHAYYVACKYLGFDSTKELNTEELNKIYSLIREMNFDAWGTDNIKKDIVAKNLDLGFMWTGDFLYYYCEQAAGVLIDAYLAGDLTIDNIDDFIKTITSDERIYSVNGNEYQIGFDIYIPNDTIAFCDNLIITKDAGNKDLAYKFLDFMNSISCEVEEEEVSPAYANCYYVCYNTPLKGIYDEITGLSDYEYASSDFDLFDEETNNGTDPYETTLYNTFYDTIIGLSFKDYYPEDETKGSILNNFDRKYLNTINTVFNNSRA